MTRNRKAQWLPATLAALAIGTTATCAQAAYITNSGGVVLADDFEAPIGAGNGYTLGNTLSGNGPWVVSTAANSGNNYAIAGQATSETDQSMKIHGSLSTVTTVGYQDTAHNAPTEYYIQWDWQPGADSLDRTSNGSKDRILFADSNGLKTILIFGVNTTYDGGTPSNHYYVYTGDGKSTLSLAVPTGQWDTIQLHLVPGATTSDPWVYSLWIDGQNQALNQSFSKYSSSAAKADKLQYEFAWHDGTSSYVDNFSWRTDQFATAVPEPASIMLMGLFGMGLLASRSRGRH